MVKWDTTCRWAVGVGFGFAVLLGGGCQHDAPQPAATQKTYSAITAETRDVVVDKGPIILRSPGMPPLVLQPLPEMSTEGIPPEILADKNLTMISVPAGTVVTQNAGGVPSNIVLMTEYANDDVMVRSFGNMVFGITTKHRSEGKRPVATRPGG